MAYTQGQLAQIKRVSDAINSAVQIFISSESVLEKVAAINQNAQDVIRESNEALAGLLSIQAALQNNQADETHLQPVLDQAALNESNVLSLVAALNAAIAPAE